MRPEQSTQRAVGLTGRGLSSLVRGEGSKTVGRLAHDLRAAFPEMKGFSPRNLK